MKRRSILKAMLLAPLAPLLGLLPAPAAAGAQKMIVAFDLAGTESSAVAYWVGVECANGFELIRIEEFTQHYDRWMLEAMRGSHNYNKGGRDG